NDEATLRKVVPTTLTTTFKQQSEQWLKELKARKRNPIKRSTESGFASHLRYINSVIGEWPLSEVNNRTMKGFIARMSAERRIDAKGKDHGPRFTPKTIENYFTVVKMVVASALNEDLEPIYRVTWNAQALDLPSIDDQLTPSFTGDEITTILEKAEGQH